MSGTLSSLAWVSSAATRCGPQHATNEDNYGEMEELGVFVVADGVGGYSHGDLASAAVVGIVHEAVSADQDFDARVAAVDHALRSVCAALWHEAQDRPDASIIASTVVALVLSDQVAACLWAGDSRIYLHREGHLYRLTQDHSLAEEFGTTGSAGAQLTRAIGSAAEIELGRRVTDLMPGDVFLLCSDGITKILDDHTIADFLDGSTDGLAHRLIGAVAERGASDDATAIVVRYIGP